MNTYGNICENCNHWKHSFEAMYGVCILRYNEHSPKHLVPFEFKCDRFMLKIKKEKKDVKKEKDFF